MTSQTHGAPARVSASCSLVKIQSVPASMTSLDNEKTLDIRRQISLSASYLLFINIDQRRSLVITIYLYNCIWSLHFLSFNVGLHVSYKLGSLSFLSAQLKIYLLSIHDNCKYNF